MPSIFDHPYLKNLSPHLTATSPPPEVRQSSLDAQDFVENSAREVSDWLGGRVSTGPYQSLLRHNSRAYFRLDTPRGGGFLKISTGHNFFEFEQEVAKGRWAAQQGFAPRQTVLPPPFDYVQLHEWVEGTAFSKSKQNLVLVLEHLRALHKSELLPDLIFSKPCLTVGARYHRDAYLKPDADAPLSLKKFDKRVRLIDKIAGGYAYKPAMGHGDVTADNLFIVPSTGSTRESRDSQEQEFSAHKKVIFVDWEGEFLQEPLHEVGKFLAFSSCDQDEVDHLLRIYLQRPAKFREYKFVRTVMAGTHLDRFGYLSKLIRDGKQEEEYQYLKTALCTDEEIFSVRFFLQWSMKKWSHRP